MTTPRPTVRCPECGAAFAPKHGRQSFCTPAHKVAFHDREKVRGRQIPTYLQAWRGARHSRDPAKKEAAKLAFARLCRLADEWNAEDKAAGRIGAVEMNARQMARGFR